MLIYQWMGGRGGGIRSLLTIDESMLRMSGPVFCADAYQLSQDHSRLGSTCILGWW